MSGFFGPRRNVGDVFVCKAGWSNNCSEHWVKRVVAVRGVWLDTEIIQGMKIKKEGRGRWIFHRKDHEDVILPTLREAAIAARVACAATPLDALAIVAERKI